MVIFGWGPHKQKDLGEVAPVICPNCHNQVFLHHVQSKKAVRLYFVPVMPYGTHDYLVCPVCSRGLQLSDSQLPQVRAMSRVTASFRARRVTEAEYQTRVEQFWRRLGVHPAGQVPAAAPPAQPPAATPAPPAPGDDQDWISQLRTLARLHDEGALSDADYAAAKRRVLEQK